MDYVIGIDSSTTATKTILVSDRGDVVSTASVEYPLLSPKPLWSEQDPNHWWEAVVNGIRSVLLESAIEPERVKSVGLTGQMHGLVLLDSSGKVLRPAILWNDQRTAAECDEIRESVGVKRLVEITGNDALTGFTAPKILWVRNNEPAVYKSIRQMLLPKDYVRFRLTGEYATDKAGGSGTLLFDVRQRDWSAEVLDLLKIDSNWLPKSFEGTDVTGLVSKEAAELTGLLPGTPVVAGGGDQAAQAIGSGIVTDGVQSLTIGTSGVLFASQSKLVIEKSGLLHAFCHAAPGRWHNMGVMLSAAGSYRWFRDAILPGQSFAEVNNRAGHAAAGSGGLLFLPYLTGERTPHPDPDARGGFVGLTARHGVEEMARSVLEGVAFGFRDMANLLSNSGSAKPDEYRVSGGGAKSELWRSIMASILGSSLLETNIDEGAAFGAAVLAGVGSEIWPSVDDAVRETVKTTGQTDPDPGLVDRYDQLYGVYRDLYPALREQFGRLSRFERH